MANGAVSGMILKVSCESLGIKNSAIMDDEMKKKDALIDAFVSGGGPKKLGAHSTAAPAAWLSSARSAG